MTAKQGPSVQTLEQKISETLVYKAHWKRPMNPRSLANLQPGQKGSPPGPGRHPKDVSLTTLLKEELEKIPEGEKHGRNWRQLLVLAWVTGALKNPVMLKEILDRIDGRPTQPVHIGGGLTITVTLEQLWQAVDKERLMEPRLVLEGIADNGNSGQ